MRVMKRGIASLLMVLVLGAPAWAERVTDQYTPVTKTASITTAATAATLWTPASGFRIVLQGCYVSASGAVNVTFQVAGSNVIPTIYFPSVGSIVIGGGYAPIYYGAKDAVLTYTTSTNANVSIMCWGFEEAR